MAAIEVGIVVVSDSAFSGERADGCVSALQGVLPHGEAAVESSAVVPDEIAAIRNAVREMCDRKGLALVLTAGGTGLGPRDVTPEAVEPLLEKRIPGIPELMRVKGAERAPASVLSRSVAGTRRKSIIITLPGSPKGAAESLSCVWAAIPHALEVLRGEARECAKAVKSEK